LRANDSATLQLASTPLPASPLPEPPGEIYPISDALALRLADMMNAFIFSQLDQA
jgi:hypothetical protein